MTEMETPLQPILLTADSQLLFWQVDGEPFLARCRARLGDEPRAAYIGASNGDVLDFYHLFRGAMEGVGISRCRMIPSVPSEEDLEFIDEADLILLAGGDVARGWEVMKDNGITQKLIERYYTGALLAGVSAGAVQLGLFGLYEEGEAAQPFETLKLVPYLIDAHAEPDWDRLRRAMPSVGEHVRGLGIPTGGGALIHGDLAVEPVRHPLTEMTYDGDRVTQALIFPPGPGSRSSRSSFRVSASTP